MEEGNNEVKHNYIKEFLEKDFYNAVYFCLKWDGCNNIYFSAKQPEDLVLEVLEKIAEGENKCYTKTYRHFRNSVYHTLKWRLLSYFEFDKKIEDLKEEDCENQFTDTLPVTEPAEWAADTFSKCINEKFDIEEFWLVIYSMFDESKHVFEIMVLEEIRKGGKREDIAESLGLLPREVTNIQKRIITRINKNKTLLKGLELWREEEVPKTS